MRLICSIAALWAIAFSAMAEEAPRDPLYVGTGSWGQDYPDQWALRRVGFDDSRTSAWRSVSGNAASTIVAIIDTGIDWNHADIAWETLWQNPRETPNNGIDDDGNGYVDDMMGWNFVEGNNKPWDHDGHGTFVAGVIGATWNNGIGGAGIDPNVRLMVLKALNTFGNTRASLVAEAIVYAANNGAQVINLSVGGEGTTEVERQAMAYARNKGVLVVIASGNEGRPMTEWSYGDDENAIIVSASDFEDQRTVFSNWGPEVDIAAPGLDILSLRARYTDTMRGIPGVDYENGGAYVGEDKRYYRASGTSFAAPIVAGTASVILSTQPDLSAAEISRMLLHSAKDIGVAGVDQYTGYGLLDAKGAINADPDFFVEARIDGVEVIQTPNGLALRILGVADASVFARATIELGAGKAPTSWSDPVATLSAPVNEDALADIPASLFAGSPSWVLRLTTTHTNGRTREAQYQLDLE